MNLVNVVLIDNHLHHCTIVNRDFVIRLRNENGSLTETDSAVRTALCIRDSFECCERGRSRVWPTQLAFAIREWERGTEGGAESERLTEWFTATGNTTERTNERTNDSFWRTERRELIRANKSWNPSLVRMCNGVEYTWFNYGKSGATAPSIGTAVATSHDIVGWCSRNYTEWYGMRCGRSRSLTWSGIINHFVRFQMFILCIFSV